MRIVTPWRLLLRRERPAEGRGEAAGLGGLGRGDLLLSVPPGAVPTCAALQCSPSGRPERAGALHSRRGTSPSSLSAAQVSEADQTSVRALDSVQGERSRRARLQAAKRASWRRCSGGATSMLPGEASASVRAGDLTSEGCC